MTIFARISGTLATSVRPRAEIAQTETSHLRQAPPPPVQCWPNATISMKRRFGKPKDHLLGTEFVSTLDLFKDSSFYLVLDFRDSRQCDCVSKYCASWICFARFRGLLLDCPKIVPRGICLRPLVRPQPGSSRLSAQIMLFACVLFELPT